MRETLDLKTIENYFQELKLFILELQFCIENIEELVKVQSDGINLKPISGFLSHYVYLSYSHISIITYKIYKPQEKRSFQKLFNKFRNFKYSDDFKNLLKKNSELDDENLIKTKDDLLKVITEIENRIANNKDTIEKMLKRRETFYAHTDPDKLHEAETLEEIKKIRDFTKKIYNILYGKFFGKYYMFEGIKTLISEILDDRKFVDEYWKNKENKIN
jgi:hypothetical protein